MFTTDKLNAITSIILFAVTQYLEKGLTIDTDSGEQTIKHNTIYPDVLKHLKEFKYEKFTEVMIFPIQNMPANITNDNDTSSLFKNQQSATPYNAFQSQYDAYENIISYLGKSLQVLPPKQNTDMLIYYLTCYYINAILRKLSINLPDLLLNTMIAYAKHSKFPYTPVI